MDIASFVFAISGAFLIEFLIAAIIFYKTSPEESESEPMPKTGSLVISATIYDEDGNTIAENEYDFDFEL